MMAAIPSTGNLGVDISIVVITGGAVTTWLTLLFDRLSKKRKKGTWTEDDYQSSVYYIGLYLYRWRKFFQDVGYMQLDDLHSENVIQEFGQNPLLVLLNDNSIGIQRVNSLRSMIGDETNFNSFVNGIPFDQPTDSRAVVYNAYKTLLLILRIEQMARFLDSHKIGSFTEEQLMKLQNSVDEFGVKHLNNLYNYEADVVYCLLEAPSRKAVEMNHARLNCKCDWIKEVKTTT